MAKPCMQCGQFVESLPDGRRYNDDGTWHKDTCRPNPEAVKRIKLRQSNWRSKNIPTEEEMRDES